MLKSLEPMVDMLTMSREHVWRELAGLLPEQYNQVMPHGEWSIKDALAHLAGNEALMTDALASIANGSQESEREFDNEANNRAQVEHGRHETIDQVWRELDANRRRLLDLLDHLTPEQLQRRGTHPYQGMMTVREFLPIIYTHEETHAREMIEWARHLKKSEDIKRL